MSGRAEYCHKFVVGHDVRVIVGEVYCQTFFVVGHDVRFIVGFNVSLEKGFSLSCLRRCV